MSRTRGEGRSSAEKSGRLVEDPSARRVRNERLRQEERYWEGLAGPIVTTFVTPEGDVEEVRGDQA